MLPRYLSYFAFYDMVKKLVWGPFPHSVAARQGMTDPQLYAATCQSYCYHGGHLERALPPSRLSLRTLRCRFLHLEVKPTYAYSSTSRGTMDDLRTTHQYLPFQYPVSILFCYNPVKARAYVPCTDSTIASLLIFKKSMN